MGDSKGTKQSENTRNNNNNNKINREMWRCWFLYCWMESLFIRVLRLVSYPVQKCEKN